MSKINLALVFALYFLHLEYSHALLVEVAASNQSSHPIITHNLGNTDDLTLDLQLHNESEDIIGLSVWQLELILEDDVSTNGALLVNAISDPPSPFFESFIDPLGPPAISPTTPLPAAHVLVSDADIPAPPTLPGKFLSPGESRVIAEIEIKGLSTASGKFYLTLGNFDPLMPMTSSTWSTDGFPPTPMQFSNFPTIDQSIILAEIFWENADFDINNQVGGQDFLTWQKGFGLQGDHQDGDSNGDATVDLLDLGSWQVQYGGLSETGTLSLVPESSTALTLVTYICAALTVRYRSSRFYTAKDQ